MTDTSRVICSITAFTFLAIFILVEHLPADYILQLYVILTSDRAILNLIIFIPIMIILSIKTKDFGYALLLIIIMTGQVMFVHVYADNYTIATSSKQETTTKDIKIHYSSSWNKA